MFYFVFLHSHVQYGISGAFWYAAGTTTQLFLFSVLVYRLKICSPGAKTFLQVIRTRFGKTTHLTFCSFAILTNVIVTALLMLGKADLTCCVMEEIPTVRSEKIAIIFTQ